jgi:hypothetical protein
MQDVEKVIKRSRRYWYVDGITELYMGSISLLAGLFYLSLEGINALVKFLFVPTQAVPLFFFSPWVVPVLFSHIILLMSFVSLTLFLQQRATKFRESFTYPRIGYLAPRTSKRSPNLILATFFIGAQLLLAYMFITPLGALISVYMSLNRFLFWGGLFFSFLYLYPAVNSALTRFYILSAVSTLLSIVLFQSSIRPGMNMVIYTILMGVALLISGGFTFRNFSRQNPLPKDELVISNDLDNVEPDIGENMTNQEIQEVIKRLPHYWFVDGIMELSLGSLWIYIGLFQLINDGIGVLIKPLYFVPPPQESLLTMWQLTLLQFGLIVILGFLGWYSLTVVGRRLNLLKERFCYPRLRYLVSRPPASKQLLKLKMFKLIGIACAFLPILIFLIMFTFSPLNMTILVACLSFSFVFLLPAVSLGVTRFYILTALSVLLSIVLFQVKIMNGIQLYMALMGVALMISGGFTFRNFVRQNPLPKEEV